MFNKIDWALLRQQKADLLNVIGKADEDQNISRKELHSLNGILHLIDAVQDYAVDELNISSKTVFNGL